MHNQFFIPEKQVLPAKIGAYLRIKDEINTIEATLNSIEGVFDHIVIIHSSEPDDGSVALMNKWCVQRNYCEIHEYPYRVVPPHDEQYKKGNVPYKNKLAAYYNWGLRFFEPEEWVVKIDGDQIYINAQLKQTINYIRQYGKNEYLYGIQGYNTYVVKNKLVKYKPHPINGGFDSFIVQRKNITGFRQEEFYEKIQYIPETSFEILPQMHWFHYMKTFKENGVIRSVNTATSEEIEFLTDEERGLYKKEIVPLIPKYSQYKNIVY